MVLPSGHPQLHSPVAALGVSGAVRVAGIGPMVKEEMLGVVLAVIPTGWLVAAVLPAPPVLVSGVAVVSGRVVKGLDEAAVGAGVVEAGMVGGETLSVRWDVLDLSGVEAPVSKLEGRIVAEELVGSGTEVFMVDWETGCVRDMAGVTFMAVVPAKRWTNEACKSWQ